MTDAARSIENLARDICFVAREVGALPTSDFEAVDTILRALGDMRAELEALRIGLAPVAADDLVGPASLSPDTRTGRPCDLCFMPARPEEQGLHARCAQLENLHAELV